jgi:uncharacterized protein
LLRQHGAESFIHAGDVGSDRILDCLAGAPSAFVFGNNDIDRGQLQRYAQTIGITCLGNFGELTLDGKSFAVTHGDDGAIIRRATGSPVHDYLITGHTHQRRDQRIGRLRWINPGALYRARQKTVAILDTRTDDLQFLPVL